MAKLLLAFILVAPCCLQAAPLIAPGDMLLRHDLQLLDDASVIDIPTTAWPVSVADILTALSDVDDVELHPAQFAALRRLQQRVQYETEIGVTKMHYAVSAAYEPRVIRSFEASPRDEGELQAQLSWIGNRFAINLSATAAANPFDGDDFRPDGTYLGAVLGNWMVTAGWQERWWGPSRDGSLILSTSARPTPGLSIQRNLSTPFNTRWLSWMGPWTLAGFMTELDDARVVDGARLLGIRGSFRPPNTGLEIGISRAAQWCGSARPCEFSTFTDLVVGNDNGGVNVSSEDEPGNQLGGFDVRWRLPNNLPAALYMQWIGEDGRGGGGAIGSWLRQLGVEAWGEIGGLVHRSHLEISDTMCREGGFGFSDLKPDCGYEHFIYRTGFRYRGRSLGHALDGDGRSYSFGSTLVQSAGHYWNISLRYMQINRLGLSDDRHTLSPVAVETWDAELVHQRETLYGRISFGLSLNDTDVLLAGERRADVGAFLRWSSQ